MKHQSRQSRFHSKSESSCIKKESLGRAGIKQK